MWRFVLVKRVLEIEQVLNLRVFAKDALCSERLAGAGVDIPAGQHVLLLVTVPGRGGLMDFPAQQPPTLLPSESPPPPRPLRPRCSPPAQLPPRPLRSCAGTPG